MELYDLQREILECYGRLKQKRPGMLRALTLAEEFGEIASCIIARETGHFYKPQRLDLEIADAFMNLVALAKEYDVRLEDAIYEKMRELDGRG